MVSASSPPHQTQTVVQCGAVCRRALAHRQRPPELQINPIVAGNRADLACILARTFCYVNSLTLASTSPVAQHQWQVDPERNLIRAQIVTHASGARLAVNVHHDARVYTFIDGR
jgi:hypothetical protein